MCVGQLQYGFQRRGFFVVVVVVAAVIVVVAAVVAVVACFVEWSLMSRNVTFQMTETIALAQIQFFSKQFYVTKKFSKLKSLGLVD